MQTSGDLLPNGGNEDGDKQDGLRVNKNAEVQSDT